MSHGRSLQPIPHRSPQIDELEAALAAARQQLLDAEAALAKEQAAVNAFRMHCRLTIGHWVDTLVALQTEKQAMLTQLRLLHQDLGIDEAPPQPEPQAVPAPDTAESLATAVLHEYVSEEEKRAAEKRLYRELARRFHPDLGAGSVEKAYRTTIMAAVNTAYQQRDIQTLRDLAGELDPTAVAELDGISNAAARRLQQQLLACQRRQRRVAQQLRALRQENTAQLWRKAQQIDITEADNWWQVIQQRLAQDVAALGDEVAKLQKQVAELALAQESLQNSL